MLGALALLALSTTAENQDKAVDLAGEDILIREVRGLKGGQKKRKSKPGRSSRKKKNKPRQAKRKGTGLEKRKRKGKKEGRRSGYAKRKEGKGKKRKMKNRTRKGGKSLPKGENTRQTETFDCPAFYNEDDTTAVRDFRYARNQISKATRAKKRIEKLDRLMEKAATAFLAGAAFYKDCDAPGAQAVYEGLSQCNVTAAQACNASDLKSSDKYTRLEPCIIKLENTMDSSKNCLSKGKCGDNGTCAYDPIGMVPDRTCDYIYFEKTVGDFLTKKCSNSTYVGSFTYCNNLLKDSYPIASNCSFCPLVTTVAPSVGRIRKNLNIWKI